MDRIGVRELRQHASRYLARVQRGERFEVTDRGRLVALLVPAGGDPWDDLLERGAVIAGTEDGHVLDERPIDHGIDASAQLASMRDRER